MSTTTNITGKQQNGSLHVSTVLRHFVDVFVLAVREWYGRFTLRDLILKRSVFESVVVQQVGNETTEQYHNQSYGVQQQRLRRQ